MGPRTLPESSKCGGVRRAFTLCPARSGQSATRSGPLLQRGGISRLTSLAAGGSRHSWTSSDKRRLFRGNDTYAAAIAGLRRVARDGSPSSSITTDPTSSIAATVSKGMVNPWVASLMRPISDGPAKPPRLPIDTISAIPPAAARPVRKPDGIAQNVA